MGLTGETELWLTSWGNSACPATTEAAAPAPIQGFASRQSRLSGGGVQREGLPRGPPTWRTLTGACWGVAGLRPNTPSPNWLVQSWSPGLPRQA